MGRRSTLSQLDSEITGQLDMLLQFYNLARDAHIIDRLQTREYAVEAEVERQVAHMAAAGWYGRDTGDRRTPRWHSVPMSTRHGEPLESSLCGVYGADEEDGTHPTQLFSKCAWPRVWP